MPTAAQVLGKFAAELKFEAIPTPVVESAKNTMIDALAIATFGSQFPWSRFAADFAQLYSAGGKSSIIGSAGKKAHAPYAALANGVACHAFEQDGVLQPSVGAHPGSSMLPPILALCEETGASGKKAITAFVAGCEVVYRIGAAAHHGKTNTEKLGFHAPGITGAYAATVAAGRVLGLSAEQLVNAIGIAGSLSSGLLAFTKSNDGGMVKRLHLGRSSESGVLAAQLAAAGYTGPETVLDGKFGFLDVYSREGHAEELTAGLGKDWRTQLLCMKRYACHMFAHASVQGVRELMAEHRFKGDEVAKITVVGGEKLVSHHNILEPADIMQAQYSVPFCVALALYRDPDDPKSFDSSAVKDPAIRAVCRNVEIKTWPADGKKHSAWGSDTTIRLKDGRELFRSTERFKGMVDMPLTRDELRAKFMLLTQASGEANSKRWFERMVNLENEERFFL